MKRFDVTDDGSRLVAVGNFPSVGGRLLFRALLAPNGRARHPATAERGEPLPAPL